MDYMIWCTYHDQNLIKEYNLHENDNFKLYYTKNENMNEFSLNYVQQYLNEWVTQYYVWKNNIYSDIVGFCHYSRCINMNDDIYNAVCKQKIYTQIAGIPNYDTIEVMMKDVGLEYSINIMFTSFINKYYKDYIDKYNNYMHDPNAMFSWRELYVCKWSVFDNMMIMLDRFIKYLLQTNHELYNINIKQYENLTDELNIKNWNLFSEYKSSIGINPVGQPFFGAPRCIAFMLEHLIGIYLNLFV